MVCPCSLTGLLEPDGSGRGWAASFSPSGTRAEGFEFDVLVVASGKKVCVEGFNRRSLDAKLSIAVTANFVNSGTREEVQVRGRGRQKGRYRSTFDKKHSTRT